MSSNTYYNSVKDAVDKSTGGEERVEVNQRALIDKILARYASAGAVYRELLQNSNDAEATTAEIHFTTNRSETNAGNDEAGTVGRKANSTATATATAAFKTPSFIQSQHAGKESVTSVTYRNNGLRFRPQDWSRLKKIAEGNPDESKIGAFGVGAYTMFSICEEPMVLSGNSALAFFWKGDALWTKTITSANRPKEDEPWTSFVLPSRDPYTMPDLVDFGEFLCAALTFTKCLREIRVYVNEERRLSITKTPLQEPAVVKINSKNNSSWFSWPSNSSKDSVVTASPNGLFALKDDQSLIENIYHVQVELDGNVAAVTARYLSAVARTNVPAEMTRRMERVTKKKPPSKVEVQIFLSHDQTVDRDERKRRKDLDVRRIVQSFSPRIGEGRIFIGFRTSQTTGLAAHLAAPFVPTVEREAMDLQDPALRIFNLELLDFGGIIMRLTLEHSMMELGIDYEKGASAREGLDIKLLREAQEAKRERKNRGDDKDNEGGHDPNSSHTDQLVDDDAASTRANTSSKTGAPSSLIGFAKFMAKGVTKTIKKVVTNVSDLVDEAGGGELIHPIDPRPLCAEEHQCILLMQSFCPRQSTPDPLVGTALAHGFSRCIDRAPPVLTRSGVVPGDQGRLPNKGMEAFVKDDVIRMIVYQNAKEYHDFIAQCRKLTLDDLILKLSRDVLDESKLILLIKWWVKFNKVQPYISTTQSSQLKDEVRFFPENQSQLGNNEVLDVHCLKDFLFYADNNRIRCGNGHSIEDLPMPESILPQRIQNQVTTRVLSDHALNAWFSPMPVEIWIDFVSQHPCMTTGQPEYEQTRLRVLSTIGNEHRNRTLNDQREFGTFCNSVLKDKRCLPFDSTQPTKYSADLPSNLYLYSADLNMFSNLGNFRKVSRILKDIGVSDEFLLSLGVRKSVSIDFLFENLHTLKYTDDPKPLVEYLRSATLTDADIQKLKGSQYFPAETDVSRMFAPAELHLPDPEFRIFPFVRLLQWPSEGDVTECSPNGKFLLTLGVKPLPELFHVLRYISDEVADDATRLHCLDFVAKRLGSGGSYQSQYSHLGSSEIAKLKLLPCLIVSPLSGEETKTTCSNLTCYSNPAPGVMGFPILNAHGKNKLYGNLFNCLEEPSPHALVRQLKIVVSLSKKTLAEGASGQHKIPFSLKIIATFSKIFNYLSSRSSEIDANQLYNEKFIPCLVDGEVRWLQPIMVFFKSKKTDEIRDFTQSLFHVVEFSPFLASAGVRQEPSTRDIFQRIISSPKEVLAAVNGEENYRALLRRIASHPPFRRVTKEIRESPFLLSYSVTETNNTNERVTFELAKAADIFVIDNSFFGRMFPVKRAPHESDLEEFYSLLGAHYISKVVKKKFDIIGEHEQETESTKKVMDRVQERTPLLLSASISSRSLLVKNASTILERGNLEIIQAPEITAIYSLGKSVRTQKTTCCVREGMFGKNNIVTTANFDWFDVGFAIGELILNRCQLEDAFLISSLLEAPLEQLRARGFPTDRIIQPEPRQEPRPTICSNEFSPTPNAFVTSGSDAVLKTGVSSSLPKKERNGDSPKKNDNALGNAQCSSESEVSLDDRISMLKRMYPGVDEASLREKLGENHTLDGVRNVAEDTAEQDYPPQKISNKQTNISERMGKKPSKLFGSRKLVKALKNLGSLPNPLTVAESGPMHGPFRGERHSVSPEDDATLHSKMEHMLQQKIQSSRKVDVGGIKSPQESINIPEGLGHGSTCEVIPSQDIAPFANDYGTYETHNGINLFYNRRDQSSKQYLRVNYDAVENFAVVLERLCRIFELPLKSIAIYHDPTGNTIAFNAGGALYFNVRYFYGLHYSKNIHQSKACYSYWYIVTCHELAHNMEGPHNSTHAFYTESYASMYLPKLIAVFDLWNQ